MLDEELRGLILERLATSITASTVRRQGPKGTAEDIQRFLRKPKLFLAFANARDSRSFRKLLDDHTEELQTSLKDAEAGMSGGYWGTARKCLNIFLFECVLNRYLFNEYRLGEIEGWLEVPLDSLVGAGLVNASSQVGSKLPAWDAIKRLDREISDQYQNAATAIAALIGVPRVHLELRYWRLAEEGRL